MLLPHGDVMHWWLFKIQNATCVLLGQLQEELPDGDVTSVSFYDPVKTICSISPAFDRKK